jgi:FMN phosphatase YigB (HAD superfamily)
MGDIDPSVYDLLIFDVDSTLTRTYATELLPGVAAFFASGPTASVALATNQGGVAVRHWMELEGFGEPEKFPTEEDIIARLRTVVDRLIDRAPTLDAIPAYAALAYQDAEGTWAPVPEGRGDSVMVRDGVRYAYRRDWRKPAPGMLVAAMAHAGVSPAQACFVGDMETDRQAAVNAGVAFVWAREFF